MSDISAKNKALSYSKSGWVITPYSEDYISRGRAFQVHRVFNIPSSGTVQLVLDFSTVIDKLIFTLPIGMSTNEGQVYVHTYNVESYTGGVDVEVLNRNSKSLNAAEAIFKSGVTATATTDHLREYIVGVLSTRQNSGGGTGSVGSPKIFNDEKLIMEIINQESFAMDFEINFNWYEIPIE